MKNIQVIILIKDTFGAFHHLILNADRIYLILIFNVVNTTNMDFQILLFSSSNQILIYQNWRMSLHRSENVYMFKAHISKHFCI